MSDRGPTDAGADSLRDESWFAALGLVRATRPAPLSAEGPPHDTASRRRRPRRHFIRQDAPTARHTAEDAPTQTRIYRAFAVARALLGTLMLIAQGLVHAYGVAHPSWIVIGVCCAYAVGTGLTLRTPRSMLSPANTAVTLRKRWFLATVGVDLLCFGVLLALIGPGLNVAALYALPVLMAASLTNRQVALGVAAVASLTMLGAASLQAAEADATTLLMQAGLAGAGLFAIAALTGELAARLAREERTARNTLAMARQQALLNRLVIEEMQDGVLVVDRHGHIRAANPAALTMIGAPVGPHPTRLRLRDRPSWRPLAQAIDRAYASGSWPDSGRDIRLLFTAEDRPQSAAPTPEARMLRLRLRFTRKREPEFDEAMCVLFIEDVRTLRARAQQEKLAAMGRVSAGIAHEIRNPLAAIAQANALLSEDLIDPGLRQLADIVADNAARLRRIVDDVLAVTPSGQGDTHSLIDLTTHVRAIGEDWLRTNGLVEADRLPLTWHLPSEPLPVRFELDHLRRVMVNLLDNAWRHGSRQPGAIGLSLDTAMRSAAGPTAVLSVSSDGAAITPDVERHLFEPFFSTASRGSGLGLYICRELCERYGASIEYQAGPPTSRAVNVFAVMMPLQATDAATPVDRP